MTKINDFSREDISKRLNLFVEYAKKNISKLEDKPGLKKQARDSYRNKGALPSAPTLAQWAILFGLHIDWLLTGTGEMLRQQSSRPEQRRGEATVGELAQEILLLNQDIRRLREENALLRDHARDKLNPAMTVIGANNAARL